MTRQENFEALLTAARAATELPPAYGKEDSSLDWCAACGEEDRMFTDENAGHEFSDLAKGGSYVCSYEQKGGEVTVHMFSDNANMREDMTNCYLAVIEKWPHVHVVDARRFADKAVIFFMKITRPRPANVRFHYAPRGLGA